MEDINKEGVKLKELEPEHLFKLMIRREELTR